MGIITYERGCADRMIFANDWEAGRWYKNNDTLVIHELWQFINTNRNLPFDKMYEMLKTLYKLKTVKSSADIQQHKNRIEILTKGVFPKIVILKIENEQD